MENRMLGTQSKLFPFLKFNCWSFCAAISVWCDLAFRLPISVLENYSRPSCKWFETGTKTTGWVKVKKISFYNSLGSCRMTGIVGVQFSVLFGFKATTNFTFQILEEQIHLKTMYACLYKDFLKSLKTSCVLSEMAWNQLMGQKLMSSLHHDYLGQQKFFFR